MAPGSGGVAALLSALEHFHGDQRQLRLNELICLLYVAEHEGITVGALAQVARLTPATASRTVRGLCRSDMPGALPPYLGLLEMRIGAGDARERLLFLSAAGRRLCETCALERDDKWPARSAQGQAR